MSAQLPPVPPQVADDVAVRISESNDRLSESSSRSATAMKLRGFRAGVGLKHVARRTLGIFLLLVTVFLWTTSNFLASYIFADNTYSKPYFVTYLNTAMFAFSLIPILFRLLHQHGLTNIRAATVEFWHGRSDGYSWIGKSSEEEDEAEDTISSSRTLLLSHEDRNRAMSILGDAQGLEAPLSVRETARLSLEFCLLWFVANYLVASCLEYTSVASSTILTSTSSIFTLLFGAAIRVEVFSFKKLLGVLASLTGIILISLVDLAGPDNDENRGKFPHKTQAEIAIGDLMALGSAVMYGLYAVVMKKRIGNEDRVNMPLFFGLVGLFNTIFLWPGFIILHFTGLEEFQLPPTGHIWTIVLLNSLFSFVSDYSWAYAMLLTTPLVVTVGLSMTIPLSLVGQMVLSAQYSSAMYWVGAGIILLSFLFVNHESREEEEGTESRGTGVGISAA